ncbi:hypothetical protein EZL74_07690 [Flavobacterium silvisoli]|uniref:Nucleotide-diphospho-sugar transferase domain-containing protein n=1 Tax=Flavobacterium silvisoli TaxID=2529433 RepID=A0A4Q9YZE9_9FLAO|nr:hypothetical protein [Flavobacterium silvisoli]TBX69247.1 hypothetical protein EZL74_07690 [Flavobacterium silvisoli]
MDNNGRIAIITTLINKDLYQKSAQLFPKGIQKYVIEGSKGMFALDSICYMMKKLKGKGIEWLIMADEDVLFMNPDGVYDIIDYLQTNDFIVCGVRDGGQIKTRKQSPFAINTFFSVVNFKKLEQLWDSSAVHKNQYILPNEFQEDLAALKEEYDVMSLYEPYYCFYFWLRRKGEKIFFLNATEPFEDDGLTTMVFDTSGKELLYHTWYARSYGENEKHTQRIDKVFDLIKFDDTKNPEYIYFYDKLFYFKKYWRKNRIRVKMKLELLLNKLRQK